MGGGGGGWVSRTGEERALNLNRLLRITHVDLIAPVGANSKFLPLELIPLLVVLMSRETSKNTQKYFPFVTKNGG